MCLIKNSSQDLKVATQDDSPTDISNRNGSDIVKGKELFSNKTITWGKNRKSSDTVNEKVSKTLHDVIGSSGGKDITSSILKGHIQPKPLTARNIEKRPKKTGHFIYPIYKNLITKNIMNKLMKADIVAKELQNSFMKKLQSSRVNYLTFSSKTILAIITIAREINARGTSDVAELKHRLLDKILSGAVNTDKVNEWAQDLKSADNKILSKVKSGIFRELAPEIVENRIDYGSIERKIRIGLLKDFVKEMGNKTIHGITNQHGKDATLKEIFSRNPNIWLKLKPDQREKALKQLSSLHSSSHHYPPIKLNFGGSGGGYMGKDGGVINVPTSWLISNDPVQVFSVFTHESTHAYQDAVIKDKYTGVEKAKVPEQVKKKLAFDDRHYAITKSTDYVENWFEKQDLYAYNSQERGAIECEWAAVKLLSDSKLTVEDLWEATEERSIGKASLFRMNEWDSYMRFSESLATEIDKVKDPSNSARNYYTAAQSAITIGPLLGARPDFTYVNKAVILVGKMLDTKAATGYMLYTSYKELTSLIKKLEKSPDGGNKEVRKLRLDILQLEKKLLNTCVERCKSHKEEVKQVDQAVGYGMKWNEFVMHKINGIIKNIDSEIHKIAV